MATYHSDRRRVRRYGEMRKSVTLGTSFHSPMPMPFRPDGLPDWDTPGLGSFVSFALENGPLKGRVVILRRLQNGMYVIAPDDASSKNDENRDLDKEKLRKEEGINPDEEIQNALESTMKAYRSAAWTRKEGKNPRGGLNAKGRASAKREGHNLRPPVKQAKSLSEMKRQYSFLSRMSGMPGPERDENGKPTRLLLSLQAWGASSKAAAKRKAAALKRRIDAAETQKSLARTFGEEEIMKLMFKANGDIPSPKELDHLPEAEKKRIVAAERAAGGFAQKRAELFGGIEARLAAKNAAGAGKTVPSPTIHPGEDAPRSDKMGPGETFRPSGPRRTSSGPATAGSFASAAIPGARQSATAKTTADTAARAKELRATMPIEDYMDHAEAQHHLAGIPLPRLGGSGQTTLGSVLSGPGVTAGSRALAIERYGTKAKAAVAPHWPEATDWKSHFDSLVTPESGTGRKVGQSHIEDYMSQGLTFDKARESAAHRMRELDIQDIITSEARGMQPRRSGIRFLTPSQTRVETANDRNTRMAQGEAGARGLDQGRPLVMQPDQSEQGFRQVLGRPFARLSGGQGRGTGSGSGARAGSGSEREGTRTGARAGSSGPMASPVGEGMRIVTGADGTKRVERDPDRTPRFVPSSEQIQRQIKEEVPGSDPDEKKDSDTSRETKFEQLSSGKSLFESLPSIFASALKRKAKTDPNGAREMAKRGFGGSEEMANRVIDHILGKSIIRAAKRDLVKAFYRLRKAEADADMKHVAGFLGIDLPSDAPSPSPEPARRPRPEGSGRRPRRVEGELKTGTDSGMSFLDMADATRGGTQRVPRRSDSIGGPSARPRSSAIWSGVAPATTDRRSAQQVREDRLRAEADKASRPSSPRKPATLKPGSVPFERLAAKVEAAMKKLTDSGMSRADAAKHISTMSPKSLRMSYSEYQTFQKALRNQNRRYR